MLIDFCHHSVKPKISCNKVSFDGYEITNLVSAHDGLKTKGFISDNFVKPPVNITVQFPCNLCIYRVIIDPVIGQQQSCDIKLFTASYQGIDPWLCRDKPGLKERDLKTDGMLFNFIASSTQNMPVKTCYQNDLFRDRGYWNRASLEHQSVFPAFVQLKGKKPSSLFNVSHLSVNVMRAKGGKSVAIKRLEVWGMPSRNVPDEAQRILHLTYQKSLRSITDNNTETNNKEVHTEQCETKNVKNSDFISYGEVEVPEDFVDQITFEIMTVPMLLPCGKNIDQSTLERFVNIEAVWGRRPSDPFTGVVFSATSQAVPNVSLKTRIDQFVTQHSNTLNVPRTLGKGQQDTGGQHKCSKIVQMDQNINLNKEVSVDKMQSSAGAKTKSVYIHQRKRKLSPELNLVSKNFDAMKSSSKFLKLASSNCTRSESDLVKLRDTSLNDYRNVAPSLPSRLCPSSVYSIQTIGEKCLLNTKQATVYETQSAVKHSGKDHSKSLSSSLDSALLNTLTSLPSFTKFSKQEEEVKMKTLRSEKACCVCLKESETVLYRLPCQHIICRACLQKCDGKINCSTCSALCASKDIVRVFI